MKPSHMVATGVSSAAQVVFIIVSDIGIAELEAELVSMKDALNRDIVLVCLSTISDSNPTVTLSNCVFFIS